MNDRPHIHTRIHQALIAAAVEGMEGSTEFGRFLLDIHDEKHLDPDKHGLMLVPHLFGVLAHGGDPAGSINDQVASILEGYEIRPYPDLAGILARNAAAFEPESAVQGRVARYLLALGQKAEAAQHGLPDQL